MEFGFLLVPQSQCRNQREGGRARGTGTRRFQQESKTHHGLDRRYFSNRIYSASSIEYRSAGRRTEGLIISFIIFFWSQRKSWTYSSRARTFLNLARSINNLRERRERSGQCNTSVSFFPRMTDRQTIHQRRPCFLESCRELSLDFEFRRRIPTRGAEGKSILKRNKVVFGLSTAAEHQVACCWFCSAWNGLLCILADCMKLV